MSKPIPAIDFSNMVQLENGQAVTTSLSVAEYFGKRHGDVLRKIERVKADCSPEFSQRNFASADYIDEQGKPRPMFNLTKDGWIMVVMGFTGAAAAAVKEAFIAAFNWMQEQLRLGAYSLAEMQNALVIDMRVSEKESSAAGRRLAYRKKELKTFASRERHLVELSQPALVGWGEG